MRATDTAAASPDTCDRYRQSFHRAAIGMFHVDVEGRLIEVNQAFLDMLGYDQEVLLGSQVQDLASEEDAGTSLALFEELIGGKRERYQVELRCLCADGTTAWGNLTMSAIRDANGLVSFAIGVFENTTERRELEVVQRHAQKLESIGGLAAGVAHELNTPIQFIGDNVRFLAESIETMLRLLGTYRQALGRDGVARSWEERKALLDDAEADAEVDYLQEEMPQALRQSLEGVERVATIVKAMKSFAHPSSDGQAWADLNQGLLDTLTVARNELKYVADVDVRLGELPRVSCQLGDLNQVWLNLLVNAAHAIADSGRHGRITVSTELDGDQVVVRVADSGTGIPEQIRQKIFEPFFTTKTVGRGTGQGLALAHSIVCDRHHGTIDVDSTVGEGTTFTVRLPVGGMAAGDGAARA